VGRHVGLYEDHAGVCVIVAGLLRQVALDSHAVEVVLRAAREALEEAVSGIALVALAEPVRVIDCGG
jgi:hypothetical protein